MKPIEITIFSNNKAYAQFSSSLLLNCEEEVAFTFSNFRYEPIANGLHAIFFKESGHPIYREIVDGKCSVPISLLMGAIQIRVTNIRANTEKWDSETLLFKAISDKDTMVLRAETDLVQEVISLNKQLEETKSQLQEQAESIKKLNERITTALEGYDI